MWHAPPCGDACFSSGEHSRLVGRKGRTAKRRVYQSLMVAKQPLYPREVEDAFWDSGSVIWVSHSFSICHLFLTFTIVSPLPPISPSPLVIVFGFYPFTSNYWICFQGPVLGRDCMVLFSLLTPTAFNNVLHVADTKLVFVELNRWVLWIHQGYIMNHTLHSTDIFIWQTQCNFLPSANAACK